jgi:2-dehydro-3-deoxyphosphooctonate aldolase (KDO 8-P synthase)
MAAQAVDIGAFRIGPAQKLALIAGPCVIESAEHCLRIASVVATVCHRLGINYVFKCSFDKANRTNINSFRGPGLEAGLEILERVRRRTGVPVLTDVHLPDQTAPAAQVCDVLQIPAFLCRQTDLLVAAARTGKPVNIKKGQFMAPQQMSEAVTKARDSGNDRVLLTDRGTFFGYGRLVNDLTCIPIMQQFAPVIFDATHSCQLPGGQGHESGGQGQFIPLLARAAVAAGADALFLEVHDQPDHAKSDRATVYPLDQLEQLLTVCVRLRECVT